MRRLLCFALLIPGLALGQPPERVTMALAHDLDGEGADPDHVMSDTALVDDKLDYTVAASPDVCRLLDVTITDANASITAGNLTVTGMDCFGDALVATYTFDGSGGGTFPLSVQSGVASGPYFRTVSSITTDTLTGEGGSDSATVGYAGASPTQFVAFGVRVDDGMGGRFVEPFGSTSVQNRVTTSGAVSSTLTSVLGDQPFATIEQGDLLVITLDGTQYERQIVSKTSDDAVTVDAPILIPTMGIGFRWKQRFVTSDPADGLWVAMGAYASAAFLIDQDAEQSDGDVQTVVQCRAGMADIETHTAALDGDASVAHTLDLHQTRYEACRVGLRFGTADDADAVADVVHITFMGEAR